MNRLPTDLSPHGAPPRAEAPVLSAFRFGTKGETLERIRHLLRRSSVPEFMRFHAADWRADPKAVELAVAKKFGSARVVVRSSAAVEDGPQQGHAGKFDSVLGVGPGDANAIAAAIDRVIRSYERDNQQSDNDQFIVQSLVEDVVMSGVLFTQDLNTGAPYYVINYDDQTGRTDTVTSGSEYSARTLYVHRGAFSALRSPRFQVLVAAVEEIEAITGHDSLDIEFAIGPDLKAHILQVRVITTAPNWNRGIVVQVNEAIAQIQHYLQKSMQPAPHLYGATTIYGQMPDWNPAEMIGRAPRRLAYSLYRHLITDRAWRTARAAMGYSKPAGMPLMISLGGQPFIDVRCSFHSFTPADLPPAIGDKLVTAWLDRLRTNPHLHDKVEFEVAITAYALDFEERVDRLVPGVLSRAETARFRESLKKLTGALIEGRVARIADALRQVEELDGRRRNRLATTPSSGLDMVAALLEDCIENGTVPFSILARHAFIARDIMTSLVARGLLTAAQEATFQRSIRTVAGELADDMKRLGAGSLDRAAFMDRYGHLRPGTYDILSMRYDKRDYLGFSSAPVAASPHSVEQAPITLSDMAAIDRCLAQEGFNLSAAQLLDYVRSAVAGREYAKFIFTRNVSDALECIAVWGEHSGLSRDELSYLDIRDILDTRAVVLSQSNEARLRALAEQEQQRHQCTGALRLPQLLVDPEGAHIVPLRVNQPNFITEICVRGDCVRLTASSAGSLSLAGKIVLIESADPGFDWIFAHGIAGLITKYGGANSHMAVRCAEFRIPAAVGCGEQIFDAVHNAGSVELNCADGHIRIL
jgi:phosphoenolpyruvate synthase/pyruvate phosphate dikinase